MLGTGRLKSGTKTLYKDGNLKDPYEKTSSSTPKVDILQETSKAYFVHVYHDLFNPKKVWIAKSNVVNILWNKPPASKPSGNKQIPLETGDTMKLFDKNGKELGTFTFKKK